MRLRWILSACFLVVGIGIAVAATSASGPPWGFRKRAAVVLETTGAVSIDPTAARRKREHLPAGMLAAKAGSGLYPGDEIRVEALGFLRVRARYGDVKLIEGARAVFDLAALTLKRGRAVVVVKPRIELLVNADGGELRLGPGRHLLDASRDGTLTLLTQSGRSRVRSKKAGAPFVEVKEGQTVFVNGTGHTQPGALPKLTFAAQCGKTPNGRRAVVGQANPSSQIFINGRLALAQESGAFSLPLPPDEVDVVALARGIDGATATRKLRCEE